MHKPHNSNPTEADIARGHELRDVSPLGLLSFAISLVICVILLHWIGWKCLHYLRNERATEDRINHLPHPMAQFGIIPPAPGVQPEPIRPQTPAEELAEVRRREQALLGSDAHGWVDTKHQFVRIPLDQAMKLAVADGLPTKLPATQPDAPPSMPPASAVHGPGGVP